MNIVCVTGMHRSGTSIASRVINLMGVDLGPEDDLMEAKPDNPKGFWESWSFTRLNEDILNALHGRWDEPPALEDGWESSAELNELRARAASLLATHFTSEGLVGWKDPRTALTLPFWRTLAPVRTILCIRSPGEVAASLLRRNGLEAQHAASLWLRYTTEAWLNDPQCLMIRYEDFFSDLDRVLAQLARHLGTGEPDEEARREIEDFLDADLFRRSGRSAPPGPTMDVALAVERLLAAPEGELLPGVLEGIRSGLRAQSRVRALATELSVQATQSQEHIRRASAALEGVEGRLDGLDADFEHAREVHGQRLEAALKLSDELVRANDSLRRENERLRRARDAHAEAEHRSRQDLAGLSSEVDRLERARRAALADLDAAQSSGIGRAVRARLKRRLLNSSS